MSTIVVNPGDVIVVNDSIAVKMSKVTEILQPMVKGAETNWQDVWIVGLICATVALFVVLAAWVLHSWISGKNKQQMAELKQRERASEVEFKKQEQEIELRKFDAEVERMQKEKGNELKNKKTEQDLTLEKWDAEHKKEENQLHRERYKQETEQAKLDAELARTIKEKEIQ